MISLTQEQRVEIVLFYGKYENINRVRTEFAKFYEISNQPRQVPSYIMIKRVIDRFLSTGSVHVVPSPGRLTWYNRPGAEVHGHAADGVPLPAQQLTDRVRRHGGRPLRACAQEIQEKGSRGMNKANRPV